jgi:hypothetical protein
MDWFLDNQVGVIGIIIAVFAIIIGAMIARHYYRKSISKVLKYSIYTIPIIENSISALPGLEIKYQDKAIDTLSTTRIVIQNCGDSEIRASDIAPKSPLEIDCHNSVQSYTFSANGKCGVKLDSNISADGNFDKIQIAFDYLNKSDSISVNIFHTSTKEPLVSCGIIGGTLSRISHLVEVLQSNHSSPIEYTVGGSFIQRYDE